MTPMTPANLLRSWVRVINSPRPDCLCSLIAKKVSLACLLGRIREKCRGDSTPAAVSDCLVWLIEATEQQVDSLWDEPNEFEQGVIERAKKGAAAEFN